MKFFAFFAASLALLAPLALEAVVCAPASAQTLKQTPFDDGTGSIGLAPGWHINGAYRGAVQCDGPNGAAIIMKMPWVVMRPESSLRQLPSGDSQPIARAGDLAGALREIMQKKVGATLKSVRASKAQSAPGGPRTAGSDGGTPAYILMYEYTQNGQQMTGLGYFAVLDYGPSQPMWQLYSSAIVAPTKAFAQMAPTMIKMWRSWKPNGAAPKEGSSSAIFDEILQDRKMSYEKIQKAFRQQL